MKKALIIVAVSLLMSGVSFADNAVSMKLGSSVYTLPNFKNAIYEEISFEHRIKDAGIEISAGHYISDMQGEEIVGGKKNCWVYGNKQIRGSLEAIPVALAIKYHFKKFYVGVGGGRQFNSFRNEKYEGKASVKNSYFFQGIVGWDFTKRFGIEAKYIAGDLDIESGCMRVGIAEDDSRIRMVLILAKFSL